MNSKNEFRPWIRCEGELCENPLWDSCNARVLWTDIDARKVWACSLNEQTPTCLYDGGPAVGGFTIQFDGRLLLFRENDVAVLEVNGNAQSVLEFSHAGSERFNDVIADPAGRVFAGTIGRGGGSGGLFRIDCDGSITQVAEGTDCGNGLGFSPDLKTLYWTCSTRRIIFAYDYEAVTGSIRNPRELVANEPADTGLPDGLTVDREGRIWSARWGAKSDSVIIYAPDGRELERLPQVARFSTSVAFVGPDCDRLVLTSASRDPEPNREADLFLTASGVGIGKSDFHSNITTSNNR